MERKIKVFDLCSLHTRLSVEPNWIIGKGENTTDKLVIKLHFHYFDSRFFSSIGT